MKISIEKLDEVAKTLCELTNNDMIDMFVNLGNKALPYAGQNTKIDELITQTKSLEQNYNSFTEPWEKLVAIFTEKIPEFKEHFEKYQVAETKKAESSASFKDPVLPNLN